MNHKKLTNKQCEEIIKTLEERFLANFHRHGDVKWIDVLKRLEADLAKLWSLNEMERTGGEPDVVGRDNLTGEFVFFDCSTESPKGRRSICYDPQALASRKENKPWHSAVGMAEEMGIRLLTEDDYRHLQSLGQFDTKTSSWLETPPEIRALGGAIFGDWRYGRVFVYHNGAESYYAARGFRGSLSV